jgi:hypothetical protein
MRKSSLLKFGCAALIAASTMLAPKPAQAAHGAALCIFSYMLPDGETCTYNGTQGNCCVYVSDGGSHCQKICNTPP